MVGYVLSMRTVAYFDRNRFYFYGGKINTPVSIDFTPEAIRDSEVINDEKVYAEIESAVTSKKIPPDECFIVISPTSSFVQSEPEKPVTDPKNTALKKDEPQKSEPPTPISTDFVPFNTIVTVEIVRDKKRYLIATNKELLDVLETGLTRMQFKIESKSPAFVLFGTQPTPVNQAVLQNCIKHFNSFKQTQFGKETIEEPKEEDEAESEEEFGEEVEKKPSNKRLYVMIGFMLILGIIFAGLLVRRTLQNNKAREAIQNTKLSPAPSQNAQQSTSSASANLNDSQEVASESAVATIDVSELTVRILNGSGRAGQAGEIESLFLEKGFESISTGNAGVQTEVTLVVFNPDVTDEVRQLVVSTLEKSVSAVSTSQNEEISVDILITTGSKLPEEPNGTGE